MSTLAIFGDSFGQDTSPQWNSVWADVGPSWIDHIRYTNKYQVTNFAKAATSFYWSKKLFDNNHEKFDKIIFIVTFPCRRITIDKLPEGCENIPNIFYNATSVFDLINDKREFKKYNLVEQNFIKAIGNYYLHVQNDHFEQTMHSLMLEDIKEKRPDAVLIPAFPSSIPSLDNSGSSPLLSIAQKDMHYFKLGDFMPNSNQLVDARKCHISEQNNKILAACMLKFLDGKSVYIDKNIFVDPVKDMSHYFRKM